MRPELRLVEPLSERGSVPPSVLNRRKAGTSKLPRSESSPQSPDEMLAEIMRRNDAVIANLDALLARLEAVE